MTDDRDDKTTDVLPNFKGVTLSGPDPDTPVAALVELQKRYPFMEIGVLWSLNRAGTPRYVTRQWIEQASDAGLRFSLHLCGAVARDWVEKGVVPEIVGRPQRIQINCNGMTAGCDWWIHMGVISANVRHRFGYEAAFIVQTADAVGGFVVGAAQHDYGDTVMPLFDQSGGRGLSPGAWPRPLPSTTCGYAGGLTPDNVVAEAGYISWIAGNFWIDMESGLRTNDVFDLTKAERVLELTRPLVAASA